MPKKLLVVGGEPLRDLTNLCVVGLSNARLIGSTETGAHAVSMVKRAGVDVVIVNSRLTDVSAARLCRDLRNLARPPAVIVLVPDDEQSAVEAVSAGCTCCILETDTPSVLVSAIKVALRGDGAFLSAGCFEYLATSGALSTDAIRTTGAALTLDSVDRQILGLLRKGYSNSAIARETQYAEITIKKRVSSLLKKYGAANRAELVVRSHPLHT